MLKLFAAIFCSFSLFSTTVSAIDIEMIPVDNPKWEHLKLWGDTNPPSQYLASRKVFATMKDGYEFFKDLGTLSDKSYCEISWMPWGIYKYLSVYGGNGKVTWVSIPPWGVHNESYVNTFNKFCGAMPTPPKEWAAEVAMYKKQLKRKVKNNIFGKW